MNKYQEERELKKLQLSNKALKRELGWMKHPIQIWYSVILFFGGSITYLVLVAELSFQDALGQSVFFTALFGIVDYSIGRLLKLIFIKQ